MGPQRQLDPFTRRRKVGVQQSHLELREPDLDACVHDDMRGHMGTSDLNTGEATLPTGRSWRRHSAEFKSQVIELARQPGISTAAVALANGLNANMLRRWPNERQHICR